MIADVSKAEDCEAIVDKAVEVFDGVDILILNAAYSPTPQWFTDYDNPVSCTHDMSLCLMEQHNHKVFVLHYM